MLDYGPRKRTLPSKAIETVKTVCESLQIEILFDTYDGPTVRVTPVTLFHHVGNRLERIHCLHHWIDEYDLKYCLPGNLGELPKEQILRAYSINPEYVTEIVRRKVISLYNVFHCKGLIKEYPANSTSC